MTGLWAIEGARTTGDLKTPLLLFARRWRDVQIRLDDVRAEWRETVAMAASDLPVDEDSHRRHLDSIRREMTDSFAAVDDWPASLIALLDDWRFEPLWPHLLTRLARHAEHRAWAIARAQARCRDRLEVAEGFVVHGTRDADPALLDAAAPILAAAAATEEPQSVAECALRLLALAEATESEAVRRRLVDAVAGMREAISKMADARAALEEAAG